MGILVRLFVILFLLVPSLCFGANYYVTPDGTGDGSNWTNAMGWATFTPARGDGTNVYYIAGGSYTSGQKIFNAEIDGTKVITLRKATTANSGSVEGWQASYNNQAVFSITNALHYIEFVDYYVFDGVTGGGPGSWDSGHGFKIYATAAASNGMIILGNGYSIDRDNRTDLTVSHVEFQGTNGLKSNPIYATITDGVDYWTVDNVTLDHLYVHDCNISTIQAASGLSNWNISYNYFKGGAVWNLSHFTNFRMESAENITIAYNIFEDFPATGSVGVYDTTANDVKIYGNVWVHTSTMQWLYVDPIPGGAGWTIGDTVTGQSSGVSCKIVGDYSDQAEDPRYVVNACTGTFTLGEVLTNGTTTADQDGSHPTFETYLLPAIYTNSGVTSATNWKIYNNSFINIPQPILMDDGTLTGNEAINNIFYSATNNLTTGINTIQYNWYYPSISSEETGDEDGTGDPFVSWSTGNYALSSAGNADQTAGKNDLGSPYNTDPIGTTRGSDGKWNRGAYEYSETGSIRGVTSVGVSKK